MSYVPHQNKTKINIPVLVPKVVTSNVGEYGGRLTESLVCEREALQSIECLYVPRENYDYVYLPFIPLGIHGYLSPNNLKYVVETDRYPNFLAL